jgi:hypothetical protein
MPIGPATASRFSTHFTEGVDMQRQPGGDESQQTPESKATHERLRLAKERLQRAIDEWVTRQQFSTVAKPESSGCRVDSARVH